MKKYQDLWDRQKAMGKHLIKDFKHLKFHKDIETYGCECKPGWWDIIWSTSQLLNEISEKLDTPIKVSQIKEKFGGLRYYIHNGTEESYEIIRKAEDKSYKVCDICGKKGTLSDEGWMKTRCDEHKEL